MVLISILFPNGSLGLKKTKGVVSPGQSVCEVTEWRRSAGPGSHPAPAPRSHPGNLKPVGVGSGQRGRSPRVKVRESAAHTQVEPLCRACVCVCVCSPEQPLQQTSRPHCGSPLRLNGCPVGRRLTDPLSPETVWVGFYPNRRRFNSLTCRQTST